MSTLFDEVATPEPGDDDKPGRFAGPEGKRLLIVGGVGGALVLAAAGYFLLGSGGGDSSTSATPVVTHHAAVPKTAAASPKAKAKPSAKPSVKATSVPTIQNALATGRDPFAPLVAAPVTSNSPAASGSPSTTDTTSGGSSTTSGGSTSGSTTTGGNTSGTGGSTTSTTSSPSPSTSSTASFNGKLVLSKLDYDQNNVWYVNVTWNGTPYTAILGSDFAGQFTFVAESNGYASFKHGDQSFTLTVGASKTF